MTTTSVHPRSAVAAVALGFGAIVFDGYDLIVYGSVVPALLDYEPWGLTPAQAGAIGSYALLGMFLGAIASGALTDLLGRRRLFIISLAWFSVMMLLVALAPNPWSLGLFRFLAGLGFGGIPPTAIALVVEVAPVARRQVINGLMLCGFPVGGVLAAVLAIVLLEPAGFRTLFAIGALPLVTLVPLAIWLLPESPRYVRRERGVPRGSGPGELAGLLRGRTAIATLLFVVANFCGFLLVFGLNTWLPQLMRGAGYALGSALAFLLVLNVGAIAGGLAGSALADRYGSRWVATTLFALAVVSLGLIAVPLPVGLLYLLVFVAGAATTGNQIVVYGYVAAHYPAVRRATALGLSSGIGRLGAVAGPVIGGALIGAGLGLGWNVGVFALVAVLGAIACALVPRPSNAPEPGAAAVESAGREPGV
ncbi:MFS transporter, AAHS family, benzoate transport protein [Pseudonocardia ammonioxydans]|uniref:MFS transporter, AAHS family, benzoate transport protein n=1 Tax=Pseudonocardia ammonioxydans TaxID=260086 RepID=A0A1I5H1Y7_PSUAM|nr:aromatic acid/H+ symport family MFS transporter [Pseudonocardia ammonioxydans]SFO42245.1 MFS transporter, AAHS family, benzoate transport protein [Pseudonocardia ammonioxydans]